MYHSAISTLIAAATFQRARDRKIGGPVRRETPPGLGELNEYYLRDMGFERDGPKRPRSLLIRM